MAGRSSRNVTYAAQEDPAFIKRFKEKVGYKEDPGIDEKVLDPLSCNEKHLVYASKTNCGVKLIC